MAQKNLSGNALRKTGSIMSLANSTWLRLQLGQDSTEFVPLTVIVNKQTAISADLLKNFNDFAERAGCTAHLRAPGQGEASFSAIFEHDKQLNPKCDRLDAQGVDLVNACSDGIVLREICQVLDAVSLPFAKHAHQLSSCSGTWDVESQSADFRS